MKYLMSGLLAVFLAVPVAAYEETAFEEEVFEVVLSDDMTTQDQDYYLNFGGVRIFREARVSVYLRNNTRIPMYIRDFDMDGDAAFDSRENCPQILFSGQQCRLRIFFQPQRLGLHRADLEIELTPQEDVVIHLRGRGVLR